MKRVLAVLMVLLMVAGMGAFADEEARYTAYTVEISDIVLMDSDEVNRLTPSLVLTFGMGQDWLEGYLTAEVCKDGKCIAGFWAEESEPEDVVRFGFAEGETYGQCSPGSIFRGRIMMACGMEVNHEEDARLSRTLEALDGFLSAPDRIEDELAQVGTVTPLDDGGLHVSCLLDKVTLDMNVRMVREDAISKPFDFSERKVAYYQLRYGIQGLEGFPEAIEQTLKNLMEDESVAALLGPIIEALNEG